MGVSLISFPCIGRLRAWGRYILVTFCNRWHFLAAFELVLSMESQHFPPLLLFALWGRLAEEKKGEIGYNLVEHHPTDRDSVVRRNTFLYRVYCIMWSIKSRTTLAITYMRPERLPVSTYLPNYYHWKKACRYHQEWVVVSINQRDSLP